ncbi:MAG: CPBP family intramembrane glutamic endopeptidase [Candidatus Acidiferrales bacterium]
MLSSVMFHWDLALIVAFLATAVPLMGRRRIRQLMRIPRTNKAERLTIYASTMAFQWLISAIILWRVTVDRIPVRQFGLGIAHPILIAAVGSVLAAVILANQLLSLRRLAATQSDESSILVQMALKVFPQDFVERLAFFAVVITVAICEEWIYRGFVQRMFQSWGSSVAAGIFGSALLFAGAHLYQGRRGLASTFAVGLIFSVVRFWTGSLIPSVVAHFIADLTAGYLAPSLVRASLSTPIGGDTGV